MKHNWEYKRLGSLFKTTSGGTPLKGVSEYYDGGTIPWLRSGEVCKKDIYNCEVFITDKAVNESSAKFVPANSVVMAMYGATAAQVGILRKSMTTNQAVCSILPSSNYLPDFLYYYLSSLKVKLVGKAYGAAQPNISQTIIKDIKVPILTHEVQEQIVAELDKINELIEQNRELLRQLDLLAQSIFYDTFGDPITNPKGWEINRIGDIASVQTGSTPSRENESYYLGNIPWVKTTEVQNCRIRETEEHISEEAITNSNCKLFPVNTILVAMYGQGKTRGQVARLDIDATTNQACAAILPCGNLNPSFLFYFLLVSYEPLRNVAVGCNQKNLNLSLIKNYQAILPPLALQEQFAAKVEAIEAQKATIEKSISELQTLLDSRMDYWFN